MTRFVYCLSIFLIPYGIFSADPDHLRRVSGPYAEWNDWRKTNPEMELDLSNTDLSDRDLRKFDLRFVNLSKTKLYGSDLSSADLTGANLEQAQIFDTNLTGTDLFGAKFKGAQFEATVSSVKAAINICYGHDWYSVTYDTFASALYELRNHCMHQGAFAQEREIIFAINKRQREILTESEKIGENFEGWFSYFAFEITSGYGRFPGRPFKVLLVNMLFFSFFYFYFTLLPSSANHIYKAHIGDSTKQVQIVGGDSSGGFIFRIYTAYRRALYFSLLSSFHIEWKDFSIREWIFKLRPDDLSYYSTGIPKVVSGIQSLMGVYLLALGILTYFGRPFA